MKKIKKYIFPVIAVGTFLLTQSCEKVLNYDPIGGIAKDSVFKSEANVKSLLNSIYTVLGASTWYSGQVQQFNDLLGDEFFGQQLGSTKGEIFNRNTSIFNSDIGNFHKQPYIGIQRANQVLENLAIISDAFRNNAEGQAKLLRALGHFDLVKLFAQPYGFTANNSHPGIVLRTTTSTESSAPRATVQQVYDQVIADLKDAEAKLPDANGVYPTKWAAKALLARVYFQMNKFQEAYTYANDVLTNGKSTKGKTFSQIDFTNLSYVDRFSVAGSEESIFEIANELNLGARSDDYRNRYLSTGGSPEMKLANSIFIANTTNVNDNRGTIWYSAGTSTDFKLLKKFDVQGFRTPVIHFTEMKLIRAEAAAELNQNLNVAVSDINDIKTRAYGVTAVLVPGNASATLIRDEVRSEREKELIGEGDRDQQIKRIGAKGESSFSRGAPWNCNGMILQFPGSEINLNPAFVKNPEGGCN